MTKLTDVFDNLGPVAENDWVLRVHNRVTLHYYDFAQRIFITAGNRDYSVIPFSKMDPAVIEAAHATLVKLRGEEAVPVLQDEKLQPMRRKAGDNLSI